MRGNPDQRPRDCAVFGAAGYTGKQIVRELVAAGHSVVCVGRDRDRLECATAGLDGAMRIEVTELNDQSRVEAICADVVTVVNAAGSFVETCEPIARAAIATRTHYVDISGEQASVRLVFDELDQLAAQAGIALIPSSAFYAALADTLVAAAVGGLAHVDTIDIAYHITDWVFSGAPYNNLLRGIGKPIIQFDRGFREVPPLAPGEADFAPPTGKRATFAYPAPEVFTIPRHIRVDRVRTAVSTTTLRSPLPARLTPLANRVIGRALSGPAVVFAEKALSAMTGSSRQRIDGDPTTFQITARIEVGSTVRTATLAAKGIFDITAPIAAKIAAVTLNESFRATGALAPAQVVEPATFLDGLAAQGLTYQL